MANKLVPITRLGKFFGGEDYALDVSMGSEWLEGDMNFTVILYRIDRYKTRIDDVYGESPEGGIQFLAPVELKGYVQILAPTGMRLGNSRIEQDEPGNMRFSIYQSYLDELGLILLMVITWVIMKLKVRSVTILLPMTEGLCQTTDILTEDINHFTGLLSQLLRVKMNFTEPNAISKTNKTYN
jgi:hypothetical protein